MESYVNIILLYIQLLIFDKTREEFIAFNNMYKSNFKITIFLCHNFLWQTISGYHFHMDSQFFSIT